MYFELETCDSGHEPIAYAPGTFANDCPLCAVMEERNELAETVHELEETVMSLEAQLEDQ